MKIDLKKIENLKGEAKKKLLELRDFEGYNVLLRNKKSF